MNPLPEYLNLFVNVTLEVDGTVTCQPNQLNIPCDAIATVTWIPATPNFHFRAFVWCESNGFLTQAPIVHDGCVISAVHNTERTNVGTFCYQLTVVSGNIEHSTPPCLAHTSGNKRANVGTGDGQPKIKNLGVS